MRKVIKKLISLAIIVCLIMPSVISITFGKSTENYVKQIANGSPIINNESWTSEDGKMSQEEAIALVVYMSNYVVPMVDNFETAFTKSEDGSKGAGLKKITFNDSDKVKETMQQIYDKVIYNQTREEANEIYYKDGEDTEKQATLQDLHDIKAKKFYVKVGADSQEKLILDFEDKTKFDRVLFGTGFLEGASDKTINTLVKNVYKDCKSNAVGLDMCGNIVIKGYDKQPNIVVFPACLNPNLFENQTLNFVNSYILSRTTTLDVDGAFNFDTGKINVRDINASSGKGTTKFNQDTRFGILINHNVKGAWWNEGFIGDVLDKVADADYTKQDCSKYKIINDMYDYTGAYLGTLFKEKASASQKNFDFNKAISKAIEDAGVKTGNGYVYAKKIYMNYLMIEYDKIGKEDFPTKWNPAFFEKTAQAINETDIGDTLSKDEKDDVIRNGVYDFIVDSNSINNKLTEVKEGIFINFYEEAVDYNYDVTNGEKAIFTVPRLSKNIVCGWFINILLNHINWVIFILIGGTILFGLIYGSKLFPFISKSIALCVLIVAIPVLFNLVISGYENILNSMFKMDSSYYTIMEDVNFETNMLKNSNITDEDTRTYLELYNSLIYDTGTYIKYEQDKSPVVTNNATKEVYDILQKTVTGQLFLGSILRQYQTVNGDGTRGVVIDLYKKWLNVIALWDDLVNDDEVGLIAETLIDTNSAYSNMARAKASANKSKFLTDSERKLKWEDYEDTREDVLYNSFTSRELTTDISELTTYHTITKETDEDGKVEVKNVVLYDGLSKPFDIHKSFYMLNGLDLEKSSNKFANDLSGSVKDAEKNKIQNIYNKMIINNGNASVLGEYNETDESKLLSEEYGYFYLTENVSPYFYAVYYDLFGNKTLHDIGYALMGGVEYNEEGKGISMTTDENGDPLRSSVLVDNNRIIDFADLRELFINVVPYCWKVMSVSDSAFKDEKISEDEYTLYKGNKKSWLFDCNWIPKLINTLGSDYGNIKVFSEAQGQPTNEAEQLIQEFYKNLEPQMEQLINYINYSEMTTDVLIRQMALLTTIEFNKEFSSWMNELQPQSVDIGGASINTVYNQMLTNSGLSVKQNKSAGYNMAMNGLGGGGNILLWISALLISGLTPFLRQVLIGLFFLCFFVNITITPILTKGQSRLEQVVTMTASALYGLVKMLAVMSIPIIILMFFARINKNGILSLETVSSSYSFVDGASVITKILCLILSSIVVDFIIVPRVVLSHLGIVKDPTSKLGFRFDLATFSNMNSSGMLATIGMAGRGLNWAGNKFAQTRLGRGMAGAGQWVSERAGKIISGTRAFGGNLREELNHETMMDRSEINRRVRNEYEAQLKEGIVGEQRLKTQEYKDLLRRSVTDQYYKEKQLKEKTQENK